MSEGIVEIFMDGGSGSPTAPALDIVFVHGLGGDQLGTWQTDPKSFWPRWLAEMFPSCRVSSFGYDSQKLAGFLTGGGASLHDLALALADALTNREVLAPRTVFVCHSLGGLIVKQMLRRCSDSVNPEYKELGRSIVGIAFLGTPHQGSALASALDQLLRRFLSKQTQQLVYGEDGLVDLNDFFRSRASMQQIQVRAYYETEKVGGILIVDKVTANPGVLGCEPIAVQSDHLRICKPENQKAPVFISVCGLIRSLLKDSTPSPGGGSGGNAQGDTAESTHAGLADGSEPTHTMEGVTADIARDFEYFTTVAEDDRRDLEQKLTDVGRAYAVRDAKRKKERFNMALQRHIAQPAAVTRYTRLMSEVESRFNRHVARAIAEGACAAAVDGIIQNEVISPCAALESGAEAVTASLVDGALYYLAGNCHVAWDNV
ncbi:putative lipase [Rhizobium laguerreae]|uniref:ABC-three component system protein n=1 Tax=Rhizobium laguerreae TaxID=1076926 RepID=UPI001C90FD8D|nr:ABC-three component system protein [Rhizobium laguerreae]MBY3104513.1 putative lipase [Rhizobium laguerreae]